jgi:hypothetical protein
VRLFGVRYILALALLLSSSCAVRPERLSQSSNAGLQVALLGSAEGCQIFRFGDNGYDHYFVKCGAGVSVAALNRHCVTTSTGKTTTTICHNDDVATLY